MSGPGETGSKRKREKDAPVASDAKRVKIDVHAQLVKAIAEDNCTTFEDLCKQHPDIDINRLFEYKTEGSYCFSRTYLLLAIEKKAEEVLDFLLGHPNIDVETVHKTRHALSSDSASSSESPRVVAEYSNPILIAIGVGNETAIKQLIKRIDISNSIKAVEYTNNFEGHTHPLLYAIWLKNQDAVNVLIAALHEAGVSLNDAVRTRRDSNGTEHYVTPLLSAIAYKNQDAVNVLIAALHEAGVSLNDAVRTRRDSNGTEHYVIPLLYAIRAQNQDAVNMLIPALREAGISLNDAVRVGRESNGTEHYVTPLLSAIAYKNQDAVNVLIAALHEVGVSLNDAVRTRRDSNGTEHYVTPLLSAIAEKNQDAVNVLIAALREAGISLNDAVRVGRESNGTEHYVTPLLYAIQRKNQDAVNVLIAALHEVGVSLNDAVRTRRDSNGTEHYFTPLLSAIAEKNQDAVNVLIAALREASISLNDAGRLRRDSNGYTRSLTPLQYAITCKNLVAMAALLKAGVALLGQRIVHEGSNGDKYDHTLLQYAAFNVVSKKRGVVKDTLILEMLINAFRSRIWCPPTLHINDAYRRVGYTVNKLFTGTGSPYYSDYKLGGAPNFTASEILLLPSIKYVFFVGAFYHRLNSEYILEFENVKLMLDFAKILEVLVDSIHWLSWYANSAAPPKEVVAYMYEKYIFTRSKFKYGFGTQGIQGSEGTNAKPDFHIKNTTEFWNYIFTANDRYRHLLLCNVLVTGILREWTGELTPENNVYVSLVEVGGGTRAEMRQRLFKIISYGLRNNLIEKTAVDTAKKREDFCRAIVKRIIDAESTNTSLDDLIRLCLGETVTHEQHRAIATMQVITQPYGQRFVSVERDVWYDNATGNNIQNSDTSTNQQTQFLNNRMKDWAATVVAANAQTYPITSAAYCNFFGQKQGSVEAERERQAMVCRTTRRVLQEGGLKWELVPIPQRLTLFHELRKAEKLNASAVRALLEERVDEIRSSVVPAA